LLVDDCCTAEATVVPLRPRAAVSRALAGPALAVAMLCAIESLLSARVADRRVSGRAAVREDSVGGLAQAGGRPSCADARRGLRAGRAGRRAVVGGPGRAFAPAGWHGLGD